MSTAHLILQGKSGVSKSFAAFLLAQYLPSKSVLVRCFDADPVNNTLASFSSAERCESRSDRIFGQRSSH
jgi:adenylylsulfate kinase-like enzyme